jgi:hypothetical protein
MNPVDLGAGKKSFIASQYSHSILTLIDVGVCSKGPTFFERLLSACAEGKILTKSAFLTICLEMGTRLIICPYKVFLICTKAKT